MGLDPASISAMMAAASSAIGGTTAATTAAGATAAGTTAAGAAAAGGVAGSAAAAGTGAIAGGAAAASGLSSAAAAAHGFMTALTTLSKVAPLATAGSMLLNRPKGPNPPKPPGAPDLSAALSARAQMASSGKPLGGTFITQGQQGSATTTGGKSLTGQ